MKRIKIATVFLCLLVISVIIIYFNNKPDKTPETPPTIEQAVIDRVSAPGFGDIADIKERRLFRVLIEYSNTNFFFDGPVFRGFDYEIMREYEKFLNVNAANESDKIVATFIVKPFSEILEELIAGRGDIAIANFTVTPERKELINFTEPYLSNVNEVIVQNKSVKGLSSIKNLSGHSAYLQAGSSFIEHAEKLNNQLADNGLAPLKIIEGETGLSTEDIFELVNANVYSLTIADDFTARAWESVLPDIRVRDDLVVNAGGQIAWAVRKESVELLDSLNDFIKTIRKGSLLGNIFFKRYYENSKWIDNPVSDTQVSKLDKYKSIFQKYALEYKFDWLSIAAMAYQESKLDQSKVSSAGAVGIMQIKPDTAASKQVGIDDITTSENNIKAGIKYLAFLRERYFSSADIAPEDQVDFTWAAYNAGPARISELRKLAAENGYDSNKWFSNVERMAAREIGRETVRYVANVNKYYIAYKLAEENL